MTNVCLILILYLMNRQEKLTVGKMIYIYCNAKHGTHSSLCAECEELNDYAQSRLSRCKYGDNKPTCEKCPVHCYKPEMREKIRNVMRFAGPRMIYKHPVLAIKHLFKTK